jgi:phenylacetate-CoA ligase
MSVQRESIGSLARAEAIAARADATVAAYRSFQAARTPATEGFASRPLTDKSTYIAPARFADLLGDDFESTFAVIASSGSSGRSCYWPQLRVGQADAGARLAAFLESSFNVHQRRTLAIVGLSLGSWIGGDMISWALKNAALQMTRPFAVFAPGNRHDEIVRLIADSSGMVDQFLLVVCPSAIGHLHLLAESLGVAWPHAKSRYLVLGEAFPEPMRAGLRSAAAMNRGQSPILSMYGSADTGLLGVESPASSAMRSVLHDSRALQVSMGLPATTPHLFHAIAGDAYLECVAGELCVTRWQGVPLVRYNLHDSAQLLSWSAARETVLASGFGHPAERRVIEAAGAGQPDLIAVSGRADRCLILCGTNLSEAMLDEAVSSLRTNSALTGLYRAEVMYDRGRQRLAVTLETKAGAPVSGVDQDALYHSLVAELGRVQPEFADDWQAVYRRWDHEREQRIIRLEFVPWPTLSDRRDGTIKNNPVKP